MFTGIFIIILLFLFYVFLSPRAFKARKNVKNSERLEIGMSKSDMINIMGDPNDIYRCYENSIDTIYFYEPPFFSSDGIEVVISDKRIKRIVHYR